MSIQSFGYVEVVLIDLFFLVDLELRWCQGSPRFCVVKYRRTNIFGYSCNIFPSTTLVGVSDCCLNSRISDTC